MKHIAPRAMLRGSTALVVPRGLIGARIKADGTDPKAMLGELNKAWAAFRDHHQKQVDDVQSQIDDVLKRVASLQINGGGWSVEGPVSAASARQERVAIGSFARSGNEAGIRSLPKASMSADSDPDGGYLAAPQVSNQINQKVFDVSPIARLARRVTLQRGTGFEEPQDPSDIGAEWVGERESRPNLDTSQLKYLSVPLHEIYTSQPITQRLLDDNEFNVGVWLESKIADKFSRKEGNAYISGDGVNKPRGILSYDTATTGDGSRAWGTIQYIPTGQSAGFVTPSSTVNGADALFDVVYSLRAPYRPNARWLMNLATAGTVRKLKDAEGRFVWADAREGQPATLCGFPVELDEEMPIIAANSLSIAFGDIEQAYLIVDRPGIKLLRDPYTSKPLVLFYAYRRVGGGLQNSEAIIRHAAERKWCEPLIVRRPRDSEGVVRWLTPTEAETLIAASAEHLQPLVVALFYTGARVGELLWLDWKYVDLGRRHLTIPKSKNGEARGIPLHSRVVTALANLSHRSGEVFLTDDGVPYSRPSKVTDTSAGSRIKTAFRGACRRAGIENFRVHDCRHTWATWHYQSNRDLGALMKLGGWKSEKMVLRYAHANVAELIHTIDALPGGELGQQEQREEKTS